MTSPEPSQVDLPTGPPPEASTEPAQQATRADGPSPWSDDMGSPLVDPGSAPEGVGSPVEGLGVPLEALTPVRRSRRRPSPRRVAGLVGVLAIVVGMFAGGALVDRTGLLGGPAADPRPVDPAQFALVQQAWDLLRTQYVGARDSDPKHVAYGAIVGMTQAIGDTGHTTFLTPEDRKANAAELSGTYVGIGVELDVQDGTPLINGIIHGGPSEAAGLRPGDRITAVDGKPTQDVPLETIASEVRGTVGTPVVLTIERPGSTDPLTFRIVRAEIKLPPVDSAMVPGTALAMIRVEQFSTGAGDQFATQLQGLLAKHPTGIILDLRGDPGGFVGEAVSIASQFLTGGEVYRTRDASGHETPAMVKPGGLAPTIPLVVLVDNGTASSAEIVAGALGDAGRAKIVGTTTFGTGTVVAEYPLPDGSALHIGTVEWLTPKGRPIWHHGITPDIIVELAPAVRPVTPDDLSRLGASGIATSGDAQLKLAIELINGR